MAESALVCPYGFGDGDQNQQYANDKYIDGEMRLEALFNVA